MPSPELTSLSSASHSATSCTTEAVALSSRGRLVSRLCLGTMTFSGGEGFYKVIGTVDQKGADELVKDAIDEGRHPERILGNLQSEGLLPTRPYQRLRRPVVTPLSLGKDYGNRDKGRSGSKIRTSISTTKQLHWAKRSVFSKRRTNRPRVKGENSL